MIDILKTKISPEMPTEDKLNRAREFLQIMALKILSDKGCFTNLAFVGGTALRILYNIGRFSEDLDFSLVQADGYDFTKLTAQLSKEFQLNGFSVEALSKVDKTVNHVFLKFAGLLNELGISGHKTQKLAIKLEVDTNPPKGGKIERTVVNKTYVFSITHFDLPSMFATKLCACFYRKYTKGRDFYDLVWYLSKQIKPNYILLNNAIAQSTGTSPGLNEQNIREFLLEKIQTLDFGQIIKDVERFLENKNELKLLDAGLIKSTIVTVFS